MTRLSRAQERYMKDILKFNQRDSIEISDLKNTLAERGISATDEELNAHFNSLKFADNTSDSVSRLEIFANAHLFRVRPELRTDLQKRIAIGCGTGLTESDLQIFDTFASRLDKLCAYAFERNCMMYIDAEQSYMQAAIESVSQQMTHRYNVDGKHIVLNGFQCYLKRMPDMISLEIQTARKLGYNIGMKIVRGAYIREEREVAQSLGLESPCWDTIEDTHASYHKCIEMAISNCRANELVFAGSHNVDTINFMKQLVEKHNAKDGRVVFGQLKCFSD